MSKNEDPKSVAQSFFTAGKDLLTSRVQGQVDEYKYVGIEKGSKLAAMVIVSVIQILMFALFWFFACLALGYYLSFEVWGSRLYGFGAIALGHLVMVFIAFLLGRPIKWFLSNMMMEKLG